MALSASTVLEVETGGSDTNGGGFVTGASGTDWSQQASPQYSVTDGVTAGTTTITSATAAFGTDVVGNLIYVQGGTGSIAAGWYQIISRTNATTIVVDRSTGLSVGTGATLHIGGAFASAGAASAIAVSGNIIFVKNGTYSLTTATAGAGGPLVVVSNATICGYGSTRTLANTDTPPLIQYNASTITFLTGTAQLVINLKLDGNGQTASKVASAGQFVRCIFINMNTASSAAVFFVGCSATTCSAAVFGGSGIASYCEAFANTAIPFTCSTVRCLSYGNTGGSTDGFNPPAGGVCLSCIAVANGRDGFRLAGSTALSMANCHSEANAGFGYNFTNSASKALINCSHFNNTSGGVTGNGVTVLAMGTIAVTVGSVFTNAAGNVYSLNSLTNQGALLRAAAFPSTYPAGLTPNFMDIGVAQHQDSGSSGMLFIPNMEGT